MELDEGSRRKKAKTDVVESDVSVDIGSKEGKSGSIVENPNSSDKKKKAKKSVSEHASGDSQIIEASGDLKLETRKKVCFDDAKIGDGKSMNDEETSGVTNSEVGVVIEEGKSKKSKKEKRRKSNLESESIAADDTGPNDVARISSSEKKIVCGNTEEVEHVKKKKKKRKEVVFGVTEIEEHIKEKKPKKKKSDIGAVSAEKELVNNTDVTSISDGESAKDKAGKKRKKKSGTVNSKSNADAGASVNDEGNEPTEPSEKSNLKKTPRKVKFADSVEVFSLTDNFSEGEENIVDGGNSSERKKELAEGSNLVQGKRFSKEEDEMIRNAVLQYVEDHHLGEDGVEMVMKCKKHQDKVKDCWKEIAEVLPWRHKDSIYNRAHILFERSENRRWTKEELEEVRMYHEKYGPKWRNLADELGRNRIHVKDAFRQVRLPNKKTGHWSQEEYQTLFNLVNKDLRVRAFMDRKSKHGMLRDNIGWEAISQNLSTRTDPVCCQKWYAQLTSSLVVDGKWADTDDYRLLMALDELDATCEEDVDWDYLLEHRSGDVCRRRWNEMVRHIGEHAKKSFSEQVETLSQRYCPDVLDARETYDSKPFVDA
ncbi:hypothetical protein RND81_08G152200 [Saponaria officinalis]